MMLTRLAISGYRSLREIVLGLGNLNVITGANGSGKSNLYRALRLLAETAQGHLIQSLAAEGGLPSVLWAGPETLSREMKSGRVPVQGTVRKKPISLKMGFSGPDYGYAIDLGLPIPARTLFSHDPVVKAENVWTGELLKPSNCFAERRGSSVRVRDETGTWRQIASDLPGTDSMMMRCADPRDSFELLALRERMRNWRFYDQLRTDREAPSRRPQIGTYTPVLASDGSDLAAALQTIIEIGDFRALAATIDDAFPGAEIHVEESGGYFELLMSQEGLLRPLKTAELSEGTLRYLLLTAALLSPRPPDLMILNEPEASLHPDLLSPLARMIAAAAERCQIILITHATALAHAIAGEAKTEQFELEKSLGETQIRDRDAPLWRWTER
jgi:predicted ATPase